MPQNNHNAHAGQKCFLTADEHGWTRIPSNRQRTEPHEKWCGVACETDLPFVWRQCKTLLQVKQSFVIHLKFFAALRLTQGGARFTSLALGYHLSGFHPFNSCEFV
jgi:hypothetical protein